MKLDVGSGPFPKAGYRTCDMFVGADYQCPMWRIPVEDGEVEAIWSSHALEHVGKAMVAPTLAEWFRVLRPGGLLELEVPDLRWVCRNWLEHQSDDWHMDTIFGNQEHEGEFHKTGFTPAILERRLREAGFEVGSIDIVWSHEQDTLFAIARRPA